MDRIVKGTAATISVQFSVDGVNTDPTPDSATVEIVRLDGTTVVASTAATNGASGLFTYTLTPAHTALLDTLTARWTATISGFAQTVETRVEIVGNVYFTINEFRAFDSTFTSSATYPSSVVVAARAAAEEGIEEACGVAFIPRYARETVNGDNLQDLALKWPRVRSVRAASVDGTALTSTELLDVTAQSRGAYYESRWATGRGNVVVGYEHGFDNPPYRGKRAAMRLAKHFLIDSPVDDRALRLDAEEGSWVMSTPGMRGQTFGIPEVDAFVHDYSHELPVG